MKNIVNKILGFSLGPIVGAIISVITIPVTTYFIMPVEYGKAGLYTTIQSIILMVIYFGYDQAFVREYHEEKNKDVLISNCLIIPFTFFFIIMILTPFFVDQVSIWLFEKIYRLPIYLSILSFPFIIIERFILLTLRMKEEALQFSFFSIILKIIILICTLFCVLCIRKDFLAIVYSSIFGQIISDIILIIFYGKYITFKINYLNKNLLIKMLKFGFPLACVAIVGFLLNSIDKVFIKQFSTYEELGYYTVAAKITSMLVLLQNCFGTFWAPIANKWYANKVNPKYYEFVNRILSLIMTLIFLITLLFKDLVPVLISKNYIDSIEIMPFLLFYPFMYTLSLTTEVGIQFTRRSGFSLLASIIALITNIILNYFSIPILGAKGAALSTAISYIIFFWIKTLFSRKIYYEFKIGHLIKINLLLFLISFFNTWSFNIIITNSINIIGIVYTLALYRKDIFFIYHKLKEAKRHESSNNLYTNI